MSKVGIQSWIGSLIIGCCLISVGCSSPEEAGPALQPQQAAATASNAATSIPTIQATGRSLAELKAESLLSKTEISFQPTSQEHLTLVTIWSPQWFEEWPQQIEALKELRQKYPSPGLRQICVLYDTPPAQARKLVKNEAIPFEIAVGTPELYKDLQVKCIPSYWFLDSQGQIAAKVEGLMLYEDLEKKVQAIISSN